MRAFADFVDALNERIGRLVSWLALAMALSVMAIVVMRYVFGVGFVWLQEAVVYQHATLFLLAGGYALVHDAHVRVDLWYGDASPRARAAINLAGTFVFLLPLTGAIMWYGWPYVARSWAVLERSNETSGIPAVFLLKTLMLAFAALLALQGLSLAARALLRLAEPGR